MMSTEELENKAEKILRETDTYRVPVPIQIVAQRLNLTLEALPLGNISGMLIVRSDRGAIGYNSTHARVRQRFTISHEIAHFALHAQPNEKPRLFTDEHVMSRLGKVASARAERQEAEAYRLGSALLMPKSLIQEEIKNRDLDLDDDVAINFLAKQFWVSPAAIASRLLRLGILLYAASY
jgi:Zn-dependent peptidase ImmA (M78 family)